MRALSIRQPFAEEILAGLKRVEYRTRPTTIVGERFYIYAAKGRPSDELLARFSKLCRSRAELKAASPPFTTGVLIGTAVITAVTPPSAEVPFWQWHLGHVRRLRLPRRPHGRPQPVWFNPH